MPTVEHLIRAAYSHWDDPDLLSHLGRELHDRNRLDFAKEVLERALELNADDQEAWTHLSFAHYRSFDDEEGSATLRRGIEATDSDVIKATLVGFTSDEEESERLRAELESSEVPSIRSSLIQKRFWQGEKEAYDELRALLEEHPDDPDTRDSFLWLLFAAKNRGMLDEVDIREEGVPLAELKIAEDPDGISGYWMLAQMYVGEKDWDGVLVVAERALRRFPDEETIMQLAGRALREGGDHDRAIGLLSRAIGAKPSFAGARIDLGKIYEQQGNLELAEEIFREIPVANPDYAAGPLSLALFLGRQERWEEAEKIFRATWPSVPTWYRGMLKGNPDAKPLLEREAIKQLVEEE
ncbi:MAG: tetratricopeptide repeat protein [Planctomycetota bacterium]|jgi:tetratricopeptide (TPR) repeat protein